MKAKRPLTSTWLFWTLTLQPKTMTLIRFIIITFLISGGIFYSSPPAYAVEPLQLKEIKSPSLRLALNTFLKDSSLPSDYLVAHTDLNKDGIDEHILKPKHCSDRSYNCQHIVIAEKEDHIVLLAKIRAREIMIATTYSYGIKDIMAFTNPVNEYNFDIYMWSPKEKTYILNASE